MKKYCPYCHARLYQDDDYCFECGKKLKKVMYRNNFDHIIEPIQLMKNRSIQGKQPIKWTKENKTGAVLFTIFVIYVIRFVVKFIIGLF